MMSNFCKPTDLKKSNSKKICCGTCVHGKPISPEALEMASVMDFDLLCDIQNWYVNSNNICKTESGISFYEAEGKKKIEQIKSADVVQADLF